MRAFVDLLVCPVNKGPKLPKRDAETNRVCIFKNQRHGLFIDRPSSELGFSLFQESASTDWILWRLGEMDYKSDTSNNALTSVLRDWERNVLDYESLTGHFILLAYNQTSEAWHVLTDPYGTLHAYYSSSCIGTYLPALFHQQKHPDLDYEALLGFFTLGFFPSDLTWARGIRIARPGSHLEWKNGGHPGTKTNYAPRNWEPDTSRSYKKTLIEFSDRFNALIQKQAGSGRVALPLSGGLDSRSTAAALQGAQRNNVYAYSYGYSQDSVETKIAGRIAKFLGIPLEARTIEPYLLDQGRSVISCVEGFQDATQARQAFIAPTLAQNSDYVMAAHWGDVWMDHSDIGKFVSESECFTGILGKYTKPGHSWLTDNFSPGVAEPGWLPAFRDDFDSLKHITDLGIRAKAFKTYQWSFRWTLASLRAYQSAVFPRLPFYDRCFTDFLRSIPPAYLKGRKLQIDYIKYNAPDLARITWEKAGANLYLYPYQNSLLLPQRIAGKIQRGILGKKIIKQNWEIQFLQNGLMDKLIQRLAHEDKRLHNYFNPVKIMELLKAFQRNPYEAKRGYTVSMLYSFSLLLELIHASLTNCGSHQNLPAFGGGEPTRA